VPTKFGHIGVIAKDPNRLAEFYMRVFGYAVSGPRRNLHGAALERGMGYPGAHVQGVHLRLPGDDAPALEIITLERTVARGHEVDHEGLMHLCLVVDDIQATVAKIREEGGSTAGEIATITVSGVGTAQFVYARDPEGNFVELQSWV
jgi:predicted enzyme related to lactoylglutathione lyase